jgi:hypothetical protein
MIRPEVRIVEPQTEFSNSPTISDWEKNQLLMKYGYTQNNQPRSFDPTRDLSYQEMMELEDQKHRQQFSQIPETQKLKTYSIDPNRVQHSDLKVSGDGDFNFEITVVSDMKIRGM